MQFIPGNTARRTEECRAGLMAGSLAEQADVGEFRTELAGLDPVNDLGDLVAARCRDTDLAPLSRHHAIDGIHLCHLPLFKVLQHAGLEESMLSDGNRDKEEGNCLLQRIMVIQKSDDILALDRFYAYS